MSQKRPPTAPSPSGGITSDRSARLYRILALLHGGPKSRAQLVRALSLDVRSFYRDLEQRRGLGVQFSLDEHRYRLDEPLDRALARMPFPDPQLSLHEAMVLAKGRTAAHQKL